MLCTLPVTGDSTRNNNVLLSLQSLLFLVQWYTNACTIMKLKIRLKWLVCRTAEYRKQHKIVIKMQSLESDCKCSSATAATLAKLSTFLCVSLLICKMGMNLPYRASLRIKRAKIFPIVSTKEGFVQ